MDSELSVLDLIDTIRSEELKFRGEPSENLDLIVSVMSYGKSNEERILFQVMRSLQRMFDALINDGHLNPLRIRDSKSDDDDPLKKVQLWINNKFYKFVSFLLDILGRPQQKIQVESINILMRFEQLMSLNGEKQKICNILLKLVVGYLAHNPLLDESALEEFSKYLSYEDVKFFTLKNVRNLVIANRSRSKLAHDGDENLNFYNRRPIGILHKSIPLLSGDEFYERIFHILESVSVNEKGLDEKKYFVYNFENDAQMEMLSGSDPFCSTGVVPDEMDGKKFRTIKQIFSSCWLEFLKEPLGLDLQKRVLVHIEEHVIPYMRSAVVLYDYLVACFSKGGEISVLALNPLLQLIKRYNLDCPNFFECLYALVVPSIFYSNQKNFFELFEKIVCNSNVALNVVRGFVKRLSYLSLFATPYQCLIIMVLVYNILLSHSGARGLVTGAGKGSEVRLDDSYDPTQSDLLQLGAQFSLLWELRFLQSHYVPVVAKMAKFIFNSNNFSSAKWKLNEFLNQNWDTLFHNELEKGTRTANLMLVDKLSGRIFDKTFGFDLDLEKFLAMRDDAKYERTMEAIRCDVLVGRKRLPFGKYKREQRRLKRVI